MKAWLVRASLLACMARDGVAGLRGASSVALDAFAQSCPDSRAWFGRLCSSRSQQSLQAFFDDVGYTGKPELFSMYTCVLLNSSMRVDPAWLEEHAHKCRLYSRKYCGLHGLDPVPALAVRALKSVARGGDLSDP